MLHQELGANLGAPFLIPMKASEFAQFRLELVFVPPRKPGIKGGNTFPGRECVLLPPVLKHPWFNVLRFANLTADLRS